MVQAKGLNLVEIFKKADENSSGILDSEEFYQVFGVFL
jgi:hypothetical protein